jgi:hypothetical protein
VDKTSAQSPMTGRAPTAAKLWRKLLCDPQGNLHGDGQLVLADLAKFCRANDAPTRHDAANRVDVEATFEAIGMQKMYRRICTLVALDEQRAIRLAMRPWPQHDDEEETP